MKYESKIFVALYKIWLAKLKCCGVKKEIEKSGTDFASLCKEEKAKYWPAKLKKKSQKSSLKL